MKGTLKGAAIGALIASAAALLLAPQTGKKTRTELQKLMDAATKDVQAKMKKMKKMSKEEYEHFFLKSLADATQKKQEAAVIIEDVGAIVKKGWEDIKQELQMKQKKQAQATKKRAKK